MSKKAAGPRRAGKGAASRPASELKLDYYTNDERDDVIVGNVVAHEADLYMHALNYERFTAMLEAKLDPEYRERVAKLREDEEREIARTEAILTAARQQLPSAARVKMALARIREKRLNG